MGPNWQTFEYIDYGRIRLQRAVWCVGKSISMASVIVSMAVCEVSSMLAMGDYIGRREYFNGSHFRFR
jgi:hypothetical protein